MAVDPLVLIGTVVAALLASGGGIYLARAQRSKLHVETADIAVSIVNKAMESQRTQILLLEEQVRLLSAEVERLKGVAEKLELQARANGADA